MPLSSQNNRVFGSSYTKRSRRRGRGARWAMLLLTVAVLGGSGYAISLGWQSGVADDAAALSATAGQDAAEQPPATTPMPGGGEPDAANSLVLGAPNQDDNAHANTQARSSSSPRDDVPRPTLAQPQQRRQPRAAPAPQAPKTPENVAAGIDQQLAKLPQDPIAARARLSEILLAARGRLDPADSRRIRIALLELNNQLAFSSEIHSGDPIAIEHTVSQDLPYLAQIAARYGVTYELLERINGVGARRVRLGQRLKVLRGPMHAVVIKHAFRMDLYATDTAGGPVYLCSFPVGLGEENSTPEGAFRIRPGGKLENPGWTNPRTNKTWDRNDPDIPIGEYWLALEGLDEHNADLTGYGIHGTNEPESIGQQASMGCIRLRDQDVELVYMMLVSGKSTVQILP